MFWREHAPPHFHAKYGDDEIVVEIMSGTVAGHMSPKGIALVQEWREIHRDELLQDWKLAEQMKPLLQVPPLE
jgi:hypothetical protein